MNLFQNILKTIKLHQIAIFLGAALLAISIGVTNSSNADAYFNSGGGGEPETGVENPITDFTVDFNPDDNNTTVDLLQDDVEADVLIYYSTTEKVDLVLDVVENADNGEIELYIGVCSGGDCIPDNPKRMVVKVQQEGSSVVLVKRIEIDDDGNETVFSSYEDTTTDLSDDELAWLREIIIGATPTPTPSPSPSPTVTPTPTPSPTPSVSPSPSPTPSPTAEPSGTPEPSVPPGTIDPGDSGSSSNSSSSNNSSNSNGSTTPAEPPVCSAAQPGSVDNLRITNQGANSVTLAWNPASQASHYAVIFTRNSDGEKYGASNIGNTTTFTIEGISGQASYTFEVFAVNDCKPGDRSSITSSTFSGPVLQARPVSTTTGQVLGATTEKAIEKEVAQEEEPKPSPSPTAAAVAPAVLGTTAEATCSQVESWLPLYFLLVQLIVLALIEYFYKKGSTTDKWLISTAVTVVSIVAFYLFAKCDCSSGSVQDLICYWYWLLAILVGVTNRASFQLMNPTKKKKK